ncbi:MAG TPA: DUF2249 domain-containing protein [Microbacteriaceae bacterium]|nr:DUF2249 domain-containing protein [Microbacteriaceae bacterium]
MEPNQLTVTHDDGTICSCAEPDDAFPPLDVRQVPHSIRHAIVLGALDAVKPGLGIVLIAPHDPRPLLAQIDARYQGRFTVEYLVEKPTEVHIRFTRTA